MPPWFCRRPAEPATAHALYAIPVVVQTAEISAERGERSEQNSGLSLISTWRERNVTL